MIKDRAFQKQLRIFNTHGGMLRTAQALRLGIHPRDIYAMRNSGELEQISRGLYRVGAMTPLANPDLVTVAIKIPKGVICLISALAFHDITTQIPHEVYVALPYGAEKSRLDHPPVRCVWFKDPAFGSGIETHKLDGVSVRIYCAEKSVVDCFKARNKIGLDVAIEALKLCRRKKRFNPQTILEYAKLCRVDKIIKPYLEAIL
jgi:predicted transcriptional regulator of viral defense system